MGPGSLPSLVWGFVFAVAGRFPLSADGFRFLPLPVVLAPTRVSRLIASGLPRFRLNHIYNISCKHGICQYLPQGLYNLYNQFTIKKGLVLPSRRG